MKWSLCIALLLSGPTPAGASPAEDAAASAADEAACRRRRRKKKKTPPAPAEESAAPPSAPAAAAPRTDDPAPTLRRSSRMEFDARLVQGEKASGAVYLFQRVPRPLPGLVKRSRRYLDRIVRPVLHRPADPRRAAPPSREGR